jgi:hypothetical protein
MSLNNLRARRCGRVGAINERGDAVEVGATDERGDAVEVGSAPRIVQLH